MPEANPILVTVSRSGKIEKVHRGVICVVDKTGRIIYRAGNTRQVSFPRSALKLFQALPLLENGTADHFGFSQKEIALMCASHNAEPEHLQVVQGILNKIGETESALACGSHNPLGSQAYESLIASGGKPNQLHNNCSGKHAGFLALAKFLGEPLKDYLHTDHPVQQMIRETVSQLCEIPEKEMVWGIDGCSAPNYGMPIENLATGFKNLAVMAKKIGKRGEACQKMIHAICSHPFMLGGTGRYCTDMIQHCGEIAFGKLGAAGVYGLSLRQEGIGCVIKVEDGATGPQYQVAQAFLEATGLLPKAESASLEKYLKAPDFNCKGVLTGYAETVEGLFDSLRLT